MNNPLEMTAAYFEGKLNATQVAELEAYLREDPTRAKAFVQQAMLDSHLTELLHERNVQDVAADLSGDSQFGVLLDPPTAPTAEDSNNELPPIHIASSDTLTKHQYLSALSYVARHTFTTKRIAVLATAAALMLGVVLAIVLMGGPEAGDPIANQPGTGDEQPAPLPEIETLRGVATLTAEHDAAWDRRPGQDLYAGQRFTLTQGFAEITTRSGAVAFLQAPATVELLDSDNALRLHTGKLVGVCETESSKGFLVRTPHMDVTDLGTRFGVDASEPDATRVHVYQGSVQATSLTNVTQSTRADLRLISGQAAEATASDPSIKRVTYDTTRLAKIGPTIKTLSGTGLGLSPNDVDPNWQIVAIDGKPLETPKTLRVNNLQPQYAKLYPNDPATSQWVSWLPPQPRDKNLKAKNAAYHFQTRIELPETFDPAREQIVARFMADDQMQAILVNGQAIPVPYQKAQDDTNAWFQEVYEIVLDDQLMPGQNTIEFVVLNKFAFKDYVGLRVAWELQTEVRH